MQKNSKECNIAALVPLLMKVKHCYASPLFTTHWSEELPALDI